MRFDLFETLGPVCPRCRQAYQQDHRLRITERIRQDADGLIEGVLHCSNESCQLEYPVIDGIPVIVPNVREYIANNLPHIVARSDLSAHLESILGDCAGTGTVFDSTRQFLSTYGWDHYGDCSPVTAELVRHAPPPGSVTGLLQAGLELAQPGGEAPLIDLGCSVGRTTFELAERFSQPALGIDLNFSMLRLAQDLLRDGTGTFPLRRVGLVYDRLEPTVHFGNRHLVDFWACDALALPFADRTFGFATAFNVLDSVQSPHDLLVSIEKCLVPGGGAALACPYDWSTGATPMESWIGGHSQRSESHGAPEQFLRSLLTPGAHPLSLDELEIVAEKAGFEWQLRLHDRSRTVYSVHLLGLRRRVT